LFVQVEPRIWVAVGVEVKVGAGADVEGAVGVGTAVKLTVGVGVREELAVGSVVGTAAVGERASPVFSCPMLRHSKRAPTIRSRHSATPTPITAPITASNHLDVVIFHPASAKATCAFLLPKAHSAQLVLSPRPIRIALKRDESFVIIPIGIVGRTM
jgi:hypothetical protein